MPKFPAWIASIACSTIGAMAQGQSAFRSDPLAPGASSVDCRSALRLGLSSCRDGRAPVPAATARRIDAFLQDYGKPPREAVRALLDPTDDNILEWLRARRRTLATARYVAERMTALERHAEDEPEPAGASQ